MSTCTRFALLTLLLTACDDGGSDGGSNQSGEAYANDTGKTCAAPTDCAASELCVAVGDRMTCHTTCSGSADECGARGSCGGVASVSVNICQPAQDPQSSEAVERPRLPCQTDEDCKRYADNAVCGEWMGARDCTIECGDDDVCNPPAIGGVSARFAKCDQDEGADRQICVPRLECFQRPSDCYTVNVPGAGGAGGQPDPGFGGGPGFGGEGGAGGFGGDFDDF